MFIFDTMSKVCIILFQKAQKFDDVINFLSFPQEKMDLHWRGRKIDIVSDTQRHVESRGINSANWVIFLSFLVHPGLWR